MQMSSLYDYRHIISKKKKNVKITLLIIFFNISQVHAYSFVERRQGRRQQCI